MARRDMLLDYFLLEITDGGLVKSLPLLLKGYTPNLDKLPLFLMRLGPQVSMSGKAMTFRVIFTCWAFRSIGVQKPNVSKVSYGSWRTSMSLSRCLAKRKLTPGRPKHPTMRKLRRRDGKFNTCYSQLWRSTWRHLELYLTVTLFRSPICLTSTVCSNDVEKVRIWRYQNLCCGTICFADTCLSPVNCREPASCISVCSNYSCRYRRLSLFLI